MNSTAAATQPKTTKTRMGHAYVISTQPNGAPNVHVDYIHTALVGEGHHSEAIAALSDQRDVATHIGVGGLVNMSYIAVTRAGFGLMLDINPAQTWFWRYLFKALPKIESPYAVPSLLGQMEQIATARFRQNFTPANSTNKHSVTAIVGNKMHPSQRPSVFRQAGMIRDKGAEPRQCDKLWLNDMGSFRHIRDMAENGRLHAMTVDIHDDTGMQAARAKLSAMGADEGTIHAYISNVEKFGATSTDWPQQRLSKTRIRQDIEAHLIALAGKNEIIITDDCSMTELANCPASKPAMKLTF